MDEIEFERDGSEELEDGIAELHFHHHEQEETYEYDYPGKLDSQTTELVSVCGIHAGDLAPVRPCRKSIFCLKSQEHREDPENRNKDDICLAGDPAQTFCVPRYEDAENEEE